MILRYTYSVWGPVSHVDKVESTLSRQAKKFVKPAYANDRKSFTVFIGGQRIVYTQKPL